MIDHLSFGVADLGRSGAFYDAAFKPLGYKRLSDSEGGIGYGADRAVFWIQPSEAPVPSDDRSGLHVCFEAKDRAAVDAFHRAALTKGGRDNGRPGIRTEYSPGYYAAFVVDPDGYRIEAYTKAK